MGDPVRVVAKLDTKDWTAGIQVLRKKFPHAIKRALTRAATSGRAEAAKLMANDTGLPSTRIKREIKTVVSDTSAQLEVSGRRLPLIDFRARGPEPSRGRGRGVSYRLTGGRGRAERAFIATMKSGHRGVFQRTPGSGRNPIYELHGPSLVRVFEKVMPAVQTRAYDSMVKNLRSEVAFALSRR